MSGGQIVALLCAILLLLPGGCFVLLGISVATGQDRDADLSSLALLIAAAILGVAGWLFWLAFRRRPPNLLG
jgi:heme/copper-type cytochrome/quinol oxidase subunit 2